MTQEISRDTAVLVLTHVINRGVKQLFDKLRRECAESYDVFFLCDNTRCVFAKYVNLPSFFLFSAEALNRLNYPYKTNVAYTDAPAERRGYHKNRNFTVGNTELPVLLYFREHPNYRFYWVIEYDVRYTGSWRNFFNYFANSGADLLTTSLSRYAKVKHWHRWNSINLAAHGINQDRYVRGFLPIYRISNRALETLDLKYAAGAGGHYEGLLPTIIYAAGMEIEDIGGKGEFVNPENLNRFYTNDETSNSLAPGTFVFMPVRHQPGTERDKLWHPVKYRPVWIVLLKAVREAASRRL